MSSACISIFCGAFFSSSTMIPTLSAQFVAGIGTFLSGTFLSGTLLSGKLLSCSNGKMVTARYAITYFFRSSEVMHR
ncbi:hypothetical protein V1509DRAFT_635105 [Lipomyces kononenkoae]